MSSEDSARFLQSLVKAAERLTPHEMADRYAAALREIEEGHGSVAWGRDGEPLGGALWQPRIRWHVTPTEAHVFVDVRGLDPADVHVEAERHAVRLRLQRIRERLLEGNAVFNQHEAHERTVELGVEIVPEDVHAQAANDILHIRCPRRPEARQKVGIDWS